MPLGKHSTIPAEIQALNLPDLEQVVLTDGGNLEINGIREASDIDLVMPLEYHRLLLHRPNQWRRTRHQFTRADGRPFEVLSLHDIAADGNSPRFDIWRWWYDPSRAPRGRIYLDELRENSVQHKLGFYVLNLEYLRELKRQVGREKDLSDVNLIDQFMKP